jgi:hypothetical protein
MKREQLDELLLQALETEHGGIAVYETAIKCAVNDDLRSEWEEYLEQTRRHHEIMTGLVKDLGLDPATESPGRGVVRYIGESLVAAMEQALAAGPPEAAQLVAAECVVHAETKDHLNWELLRAAAEKAPKPLAEPIAAACDEVEDEEDEHLYHTTGWSRELWMDTLGLPAVLPPPEEQKSVKTAIGAARAKNARDEMTSR